MKNYIGYNVLVVNWFTADHDPITKPFTLINIKYIYILAF